MASFYIELFRLSIFLSIALLVVAQWNTNDYLKREHSLTKPYTGAGMNIPQWDFEGTTMITSNFIRLTPDRQSSRGSIWNSIPCHVRNWELHVQFKVHGVGKSLFGDGFAIWYARDRLKSGDVFGNQDYFVGLAIIADTYSNHNGPHNHQHPYVSAMVNNGSLHYDHDRDGTHTEVAGCETQFRNKDHDTYMAIRYEGTTLKVSLDVEGKNGWTECFKVEGVRLPSGYYFGASAATGQLADNHDIISMKLYELDLPDVEDMKTHKGLPEADFFASPRDQIDDPKSNYMSGGGGWSGIKIFFVIILLIIDHIEDPKGNYMSGGGGWSGIKIFFVIILILIGVAVCGAVGYVIFNREDLNKKKRFY